MDELGKQERRQRRLFRGFQHHGAAGQKRGDHLQRDLIHRPVPGRDEPDHPDRLERDPVPWRMRPERPDEPYLVKGGQEVLQMPRQAGGLFGTRHVDGRTHLEADRLRHLLGAAVVLFKDARAERTPLGRPGCRPARKGRLGCHHRGIRISLTTKRDHRAGLLGRRVDDRMVPPRQR